MPIIDLQVRARELGRIRIGQVVATAKGGKRPSKLDRFRITAHSREIVEKVAALYGGDVKEWQPQGNGPAGWEVVTTSARLPVLVPPQPVSQWYETWSGGGCQRRCDGVTEVLSDQPCLCGPDPQNRECKPTTRLNVVLREVEGVGVWRLETHGYYAAVELPSAAELLASSRGYIVGHLGLEERVVKRNGETRRFMVPTLDIDVTPAALMAGSAGLTPGGANQLDNTRTALPSAAPALPAGPAAIEAPTPAGKPDLTDEQRTTLIAQAAAAGTLDEVRGMWTDVTATFAVTADDPVIAALRTRAGQLQPAVDTGEQSEADAVKEMTSRRGTRTAPAADADELWAQIQRTAPDTWTSTELDKQFATFAEVDPEVASASDMQRFLDHLQKGAK